MHVAVSRAKDDGGNGRSTDSGMRNGKMTLEVMIVEHGEIFSKSDLVSVVPWGSAGTWRVVRSGR